MRAVSVSWPRRRRALGGGEADRAAARALGLVERGVGALEDVGHLRAVVGEGGDADAGGDLELVALDHERRLERGQEVVRDVVGGGAGVVVEVGQQQHELVAAVAGEQVGRARAGRQARRDLAQQLVAGGVAERVVDELEAVEVDVEDGAGVAVAARAGERERRVLLELGAVGEARSARRGRPCAGRVPGRRAARSRPRRRPASRRRGAWSRRGRSRSSSAARRRGSGPGWRAAALGREAGCSPRAKASRAVGRKSSGTTRSNQSWPSSSSSA